MKKLLLALLLLCLASPAHAAESAFDRVMRTGTLRCGFFAWPPGFEIDPNTKEVKGTTKELFEALVKLAGWKPEFVEVQFGSYIMDLNSGRVDAICGDGPWTISNVRLIDYTTPVAYTPMVVYVRADETRFKKNADLNTDKASFAGIDSDSSTELAQMRFPKANIHTLINITDPASMLMEVVDKKSDAAIVDPFTGGKFMEHNPGKLKQLGPPLAVYPLSFSLKRGETLLEQTLSRTTEMALDIGLADSKLDMFDPARKTVYSPAKSYEAPK